MIRQSTAMRQATQIDGQDIAHNYRATPLPLQPIPDGESFLDLLITWNEPLKRPQDFLEHVSDWGPFEFLAITPLKQDELGRARSFARFIYHGTDQERQHFEWNLILLIEKSAASKVAVVPFAPNAPSANDR